MKKIIALFCFLVVSFAAFAQNESEHMLFKGIPMDGTLSAFVQQLKSKGFTYHGTENGSALLSGKFASRDCSVIVLPNSSNLVRRVGVIFPSHEKWATLADEYFALKSMLTTKYGEPADCTEEFQTYQNQEDIDDGMKILYVGMDKCKYETFFLTPKGAVHLSIKNLSYDNQCVMLLYIDSQNETTTQNEVMDDL